MSLRARLGRPLAALSLLAAASLSTQPALAAIGTPVQTAASGATSDTRDRGARAFLRIRVETPDRDVYVGEAIPAKLEVLVRADTGATLLGPPRLDAPDVVVLDAPGELEQRTEIVDGVAHRIASFDAVVSPALAGDVALRAKLPVQLKWQELVRRKVDVGPRMLDSLLADDFFAGDPLLQEMLGAMGQMQQQMEQTVAIEREKEVELEAAPVAIDAKPLPLAGQPPGFSGAVGRFAVASALAPTTVHAGEPATLTVKVTGTGNFDRVAWAGVPDAADLGAYAPESSIEGSGAARTKTFRQTIVPRSTQVTEVPPAAITFFDPDARTYVTATADPSTIEVLPAPGAPIAAAPVAVTAAGDETAPVYATLRPPFVERSFWLWQLAPLGAAVSLAGGAAVARRREATSGTRARRESARRALATMRAAAARDDVAGWLAAAFAALQHAVADDHAQASALSPAEVATRLGERAERLAPLLEAVDAARYAGRSPAGLDVPHLHHLVEQEITS